MSDVDEILAQTGEVSGLETLKPAEYNPRTISVHDFDALKKSILTFGDISGITKNLHTGNLVGGHQRLKAFQTTANPKIVVTERFTEPSRTGTLAHGYVLIEGERFGYREVAWPIEFEKAANVAANRIEGQFQQDQLAEVMASLNAELQGLTGHTEEEISKLMDMVGLSDDDKDNDAPAVDNDNPPISQPGEIYQLGDHRLLCGDATSEAQVGALMDGKIAAMVFTDPPYNINYQGAGGSRREGIENDKMSTSEFGTFLAAVCSNLFRYSKGAHYICMSTTELDTLKAAFTGAGGHFQNYIIWVKSQFTIGGSDYQHQYEPILYGWRKDTDHYYAGARDLSNVWVDLTDIKSSFDAAANETTIKFAGFEIRLDGHVTGKIQKKKLKGDIWRHDKPVRSDEHPTMKPVSLCKEAISNSSLRDQIVLDLFGGSGSTLIAANDLGRTCYMAELDPKYCDVIRKRYARHTGQEEQWQQVTPVVSTVAAGNSLT